MARSKKETEDTITDIEPETETALDASPSSTETEPAPEPKNLVSFKVDADTTITCEITKAHDNGLFDLQELVPDGESPTGSSPGRWFQNISPDLCEPIS